MDTQPPQQPQAPASVTPGLPPQQQQTLAPNKNYYSILGFVGLGLAVVGIILAFFPAIFIIAAVVLAVAIVISLIGLFKKDTAKWPSVVGLVLSLIGGIVLTVTLAVNFNKDANEAPSTNTPSSSVEQQTDSTESDASGKRPSVDEITNKLPALAADGGITGYENMPNFYPCMAKELYSSDLSDESLQLIIDGEAPLDSERKIGEQAITDAAFTCQK